MVTTGQKGRIDGLGGIKTPGGGYLLFNKTPMRLGVGAYFLFGFIAYGTLTAWFILEGLGSNPVMIYVFPYAVIFSVPILFALPRRKVESVWVGPTGFAIVYGAKKEFLPWSAYKGISEKKGLLGRTNYFVHLELSDARASDFKNISLRVSGHIAAALNIMKEEPHDDSFEMEFPYHLNQDLKILVIILACFLSILLIIPYLVYPSLVTLALAIVPLILPFLPALLRPSDDGGVTHVSGVKVTGDFVMFQGRYGARTISRHQIRIVLFPRFGRRHALLYTSLFPAPFRLHKADAITIRNHFLERSDPIVLI